ncbi:hypothetical protein AB0F81_13140 [Actinoplanes sp. NPDC024001]|uniref:hypothetical protein n=1 Tax=Actinoplanes sp. NPDC024001 TaxID=3154598 RepID=UPI0033D2D4FF
MSVTTRPRRSTARHTLTAKDVWTAVTHASFAVISHVTPAGAPRSSGVVYAAAGDRLYMVVADNSWKARHIRDEGLVAMTVPIRRGGLLSLIAPIPPATVSFPAVATVHPAAMLDRVPRLARLVPPERRAGCAVLEIRPMGHYVTYGLGVPLMRMRDAQRARARVAVNDSAHKPGQATVRT